ncbi:MAG: phosphoribosylformylglycinamidine cyclo-ligase [Candidatus Omnitrophota bacterium]|nr:phosphoribosylformylglycinamidine cyclo-ligase [Candidatus Omnitrophota bacterium]
MTYKKAGVDIRKANVFVGAIKRYTRLTERPGASGRIGGFGGTFDLKAAGYKDPVLVSSTDGVGTKLKIAFLVNKHDTVGIDMVAMNVNDVLTTGAEPLFFLDYIATGKIEKKVLVDVVKGIAEGCRQAGCALVGGETAEMPAFYKKGEYDLAGFCVGAVERNRIIDGRNMKAGDIVVGLESNGLHANGYSLVRKIFSRAELKALAKELLKPTRIYVKPILELKKKIRIKGIAHITGGAFLEKIPRIVPKDKKLVIVKGSWAIPEIFMRIQAKGKIAETEMFRTFNMGLGMVIVIRPEDFRVAKKVFNRYRIKTWVVGSIKKGRGEVKIICGL